MAARKAELLLECGALVAVVAPSLGVELAGIHEAGRLTAWQARRFDDTDVAGRLLAVAATDDAEVNRSVAFACRSRGVLVNVVDDPGLSDFVVPAGVRRGALHLAVSTSGLAPALAAHIARRLGELYPEEWGSVVDVLGCRREEARLAGWDAAARRSFAQELAALDFESLLVDGGMERVREAVAACAARYVE